MKSNLKPEIKQELTTRLASDDFNALKVQYEKKKGVWIGRVIQDVLSVSHKLIDWLPLEEADNLIPYEKGKQCNYPKGARIWELSRLHKSPFYAGQWFDIQIKPNLKRERIVKCKLSIATIEFLNLLKVEQEEVKRPKYSPSAEGNIQTLIGETSVILRECKLAHFIPEVSEKLNSASSYEEAKQLLNNYVEII